MEPVSAEVAIVIAVARQEQVIAAVVVIKLPAARNSFTTVPIAQESSPAIITTALVLAELPFVVFELQRREEGQSSWEVEE